MADHQGVPAPFFHAIYDGEAPWDVHRPQPTVVALAEGGLFRGEVLDVGCGTGDNAIFLAERGLRVTAIDFVPKALDIVRQRAAAAGVTVDVRLHDALALGTLGQQFDVVLDSAVFHVFGDEDRARLVLGFKQVTKPGGTLVVLCFSDAIPEAENGPRSVSEVEIRTAFAHGWEIQRLERITFEIAVQSGKAPAWMVVLTRTPDC